MTIYESPVKIQFSSTNTSCNGQSTELSGPAVDEGSVEPGVSATELRSVLSQHRAGQGTMTSEPDTSGSPHGPLHVRPTLPTSFLLPPVANVTPLKSQPARGAPSS